MFYTKLCARRGGARLTCRREAGRFPFGDRGVLARRDDKVETCGDGGNPLIYI
jgi:hypothetical protein